MATDKLKNPTGTETGTITANVGSVLAQTCTKCGVVASIYCSISGTFAPNTTIATLPEGFRPRTTQRLLAIFTYSGSLVVTVLSVGSDGKISTSYGNINISGMLIFGTIIL